MTSQIGYNNKHKWNQLTFYKKDYYGFLQKAQILYTVYKRHT